MIDHPETIIDNYISVKNSELHGLGLFTDIHIKHDQQIIPIIGEEISEDECVRREEEDNNVYIFWKDDQTYIDTSQMSKIKFINHSCDYNCTIEEDDFGNLILFSVRDIQAGEELTIDYGYEEIYEDCSCNNCNNK